MIPGHMPGTVRDTNFKNGFCQIDSDGRILHGGFPPDVWFWSADRDDFGTSMPLKSPGGVHLIIAAATPRDPDTAAPYRPLTLNDYTEFVFVLRPPRPV